MPYTSSCPKCQKQVTVPDGVGAASLVRCPLCEAEFELREALGPPALVVLEAKTDDGQPIVPAAAGEQVVAMALAEAEAQPTPAALAGEEHWGEDWHLEGEPAAAEPAAGQDDSAIFGAITGKMPPGEGIAPPRLPGGAEGEAAEPLPRRKRRRVRKPHPVRTGIGMILSGFLAVAMVYWGANFFLGQSYDIYPVRLPYVRHTYKHWCWWTPWKWNTPPVVANEPPLKPKAANEPKEPKPTKEAKTSAPAAATQKSKPADSDVGDLKVEPVHTVTPKFESKPAEKPKQNPPKQNAPNPSEPKPPAAEPPPKETPKAVPPDDLGEGPAKEPDLSPNLGPSVGPDVPVAPVNPQRPEKPEPSPAKPDKPATPPAPVAPENPVPAAPVSPDVKTPAPAAPVSPDVKTPAPAAPVSPETKTPMPAAPVSPEMKPPAPAAPVSPEATPPAPAAAAVVGPLHAASYEPAELAAALKAAHDSFGCPACNSTGIVIKGGKKEVCSVCKGHPPTDISPAAYEKLCRLAEVFTFLKSSPDPRTAAQMRDLGEVFAEVADPARIGKIAPSAAARLAAPDAQGGILLVGTVTFVGVKDKLYGAAVRMAGQASPVSVLSGRPLGVSKDDRVLILGHLVREPAKNLAGYQGTQPLVVWGVLALKLP